MTHKDDTQDDSAEDDAPTSAWWLFGTAFVVMAAWGWSGYLIHTGFDEPSDRGTFGDMFGAINALFSGLAFSVLIYTMILQRIELRLQRKELRNTRAELAGQKEQMEIQNSTMRRQRFEQTFFNLLNLHLSIINALELEDAGINQITVTGRTSFPYLLANVRSIASVAPGSLSSVDGCFEAVSWIANHLNPVANILDQYTSVVGQIARFIDTSDLTSKEKHAYAAIFQSTLSNDEKILLFYIGLSPSGQQRLKPYIERYALLTNIRDTNMLTTQVRRCYHIHAFGDGTPE